MLVPLLRKPAPVMVGRGLWLVVSIVRARVRTLTLTPESP